VRSESTSGGDESRFILYVSIIVAAALRLAYLGSQSIWGDESLTYLRYTAGDNLDEVWQHIWQSAGHPPLYFLIAHFWYKLGHSEFMLRFPSAVFGIAAIPLVYALARRLFDGKIAGTAALVAALSPIHIWYSQEARMYNLQILLCLASTLFFVKAWQKHRIKDVALYVLFTTMALFTHVATIFLLIAQGIFSVIASAANRRRMLAWIGAHTVAAAAFMPWLIHMINLKELQTKGIVIGYMRPSSIWDIAYGFYALSVGFSIGPSVAALHTVSVKQAIMGHAAAVALPAVIFSSLAMLGLAHARRKNRWAFWLLATNLVAPAVLAAAMSIFPGIPLNPRYILISVIPYWIIIALGVHASIGIRALRPLPVAAAAIVALSLANHYFQPAYAKQDLRSAVGFINKEGRRGDAIIISSIELGGPFIYYFKGKGIPYYGYPPKPGLVNKSKMPADMSSLLRGKDRAWLVLGRTWSSDPDGLIRQYFDGRSRAVCIRRYPGVTVVCYDL
jgi:mannosyltransferase